MLDLDLVDAGGNIGLWMCSPVPAVAGDSG